MIATSQILIDILLIPLFTVLGIFGGLIYKGFDRKFAARLQSRVGPPIRQPIRDVRKLMLKENIIPKDAVKWLFNLMPLIALVSAVILLLYIPMAGINLLGSHGDLILVLYLFIVPSLALVLGGFASGSPYAIVGAQREMIQMMSYEFPLAIVTIAIVWALTMNGVADPFSLQNVAENPAWEFLGPLGWIGMFLFLLVLLFVMPAELSKIPFDVPEAKTEIAGGLLNDYSGRNLALYYMANAVQMIAFGSFIVALFFPWGISSFVELTPLMGQVADFFFFLIKLFLVIFVGTIFIRVAAARLKISQVVYVYWIPSVLISLGGLFLIGIDLLLPALI